uniref:Momilactone A synthase n=1 Tax=Aegilops tauschii TaxID=37682 RepID=M8C3X7_AEGTA
MQLYMRCCLCVARGEPRAAPVVVAGLVGQWSYCMASSSKRLAGKVAVITGAAGGIGKATTADFFGSDAKVVNVDVQDDLGRALAAEHNADSTPYTRCDVTDEA